MEERLCGSDCR